MNDTITAHDPAHRVPEFITGHTNKQTNKICLLLRPIRVVLFLLFFCCGWRWFDWCCCEPGVLFSREFFRHLFKRITIQSSIAGLAIYFWFYFILDLLTVVRRWWCCCCYCFGPFYFNFVFFSLISFVSFRSLICQLSAGHSLPRIWCALIN